MLGKVSLNVRCGYNKHLDAVEETNLASFLINSVKLGSAHTRKEAIIIAQQVVNEKEIMANVTTSCCTSFISTQNYH